MSNFAAGVCASGQLFSVSELQFCYPLNKTSTAQPTSQRVCNNQMEL